MKGEKKRIYRSQARETQAAETRSRILGAAKTLFQREGFDRVTIAKLAETANVSMPTIYAIFKSKRGVLQALIDDAFPKEQFVALVDEGMKESSPEKRLGITAHLAREIYDAESELMDILRSASVLAPEFKELEKEREERRWERQGESVKHMVEEGMLNPELTVEKARDIFWALTGRDLYRMFVVERNWTSDEYESWLKKMLVRSLLS